MLICTLLGAQDLPLLTTDADALIASETIRYTIDENLNGRHEVDLNVFIFNKDGQPYGNFSDFSNSFRRLDDLQIVVYNSAGKEVKKHKKGEMTSTSTSDGMIIAPDYQNHELLHRPDLYPYRVNIRYAFNTRSLFFWPAWDPQRGDIRVLKSTYILEVPEGFSFDRFQTGEVPDPVQTTAGGRQVYTWEARNIEEMRWESRMPRQDRFQFGIRFRPDNFTLGNSRGKMTSWQEFGTWYNRLMSGRSVLSEAAQAHILAQVSETDSPRQKVRKLYEFLQRDTRYVFVLLGIGGWQAHPAEDVFAKKFGDCKDLSNYMVTMLNLAGVPSHLALALTRDRGLTNPDFPSNQFNHCIAMVPLEADTLWLECTADLTPYNDPPNSIEGINALLITGDGGRIIRTPESSPGANLWQSRLMGELQRTGDIALSGRISFSGEQALDIRSKLDNLRREKRKDYLRSLTGGELPAFSIDTVAIRNLNTNLTEPLILDYTGQGKHYAKTSGSRIFFNPNILQRHSRDGFPDEDPQERRFDYEYPYAYADADTVVLTLPPGYSLERAPDSVRVDNDFATYSTFFHLEGQTFTHIRKMTLKKRLVPVEHYGEYLSFLKFIAKNDNELYILKR
ncbi:MAG: transglutaminase domain-containing protein [Calditrichaeota bacterium]|nr:transglutaminase domain-containing protein [Calditrichota bacterium]HQU72080.1 transglutaminase-like domain-containing protein [Calditrichia bacterium]